MPYVSDAASASPPTLSSNVFKLVASSPFSSPQRTRPAELSGRHQRAGGDGLQGLLPGRVLQRFAEQILDGLTVLKTVEVPQLPSRGVVQFLDKVVDVPVVVQRVD